MHHSDVVGDRDALRDFGFGGSRLPGLAVWATRRLSWGVIAGVASDVTMRHLVSVAFDA